MGEWPQQGYYLFAFKMRIQFRGNNQWKVGMNVVDRTLQVFR